MASETADHAASTPATAGRELPVLQVQDATVRFGGLVAASNVNLEVPANTIVGLIGPNGAGKSTTIGMIAGTVLPTTGRVLLDGHDVTYARPYEVAARGLARTYQHSSVFTSLTVEENLKVARGRSTVRLVSDQDILERLGLIERRSTIAGELAYGEMRRLAIGLAVASEPRVLLLDEPAAGLNNVESRQIGECVTWCARTLGIGVLLVEHDMDLVMSTSDRLVVLDHGKVIARGTPSEVRSNPDVIRVYLGAEG